MAILLNIDTAIDLASVCLSNGDQILGLRTNNHQKEHASFINVAIQQLFSESGLAIQSIDAVSVTEGPGSYTGLRVGMATAKGLCFALDKPLITVSTLQAMTVAAIDFAKQNHLQHIELFCPMLDARRMEVFTAIFDCDLQLLMKEQPIILNESSFQDHIGEKSILFFGNGAFKLKPLINHSKSEFATVEHNATHLATIAQQDFIQKKFANLAYAEPNYLKDFYSLAGK